MRDVKLSKAEGILRSIQFIASVLVSQFEVATYVTNRLYLNQKNNLITSFVRLGLILILFNVISVRITYLTTATFVGVLFTYVMNIIYIRRYLPKLKIRKSSFDFRCIKQLLSSGVWGLVSRLGGILLDGLDLLLTNLF